MATKLSWKEIESLYDQEWVELVDYDWPEEEPYPVSGSVRVHATDRKVFDELILKDPPAESALIFVGERKAANGVILSANLHQFRSA